MSPKGLSGIYGADDTGMAESIASDALSTAGTGWGAREQSDYWGDTKDDDRAFGKGNTPEYEDYDVKIIRETAAGGGDTDGARMAKYPDVKADNRHARGPKTSTDTDNREPNPRHVQVKAGPYPRYSKGE